MEFRLSKKLFLGFALALLLIGGSVGSVQAMNLPGHATCQGAFSVGPTAPIHLGAVGY